MIQFSLHEFYMLKFFQQYAIIIYSLIFLRLYSLERIKKIEMNDENHLKNENKKFSINEEILKSSIDNEEKKDYNNVDTIIKSKKEIMEENEMLRNNILSKYKEKMVNLEKEIDDYNQFASDLRQKVEKTVCKKNATSIIDNKTSSKISSVKKRSPDKEKSKVPQLSLEKLNNNNENTSTLLLHINTIKPTIPTTSPNPPNIAKTSSKFSGRQTKFKNAKPGSPTNIQNQKQIENQNKIELKFDDDDDDEEAGSYLNAIIKMNGTEGIRSFTPEPTPVFNLNIDEIFGLCDDFEKHSSLLRKQQTKEENLEIIEEQQSKKSEKDRKKKLEHLNFYDYIEEKHNIQDNILLEEEYNTIKEMISSENDNDHNIGDLILNKNDSQQMDIINNLRNKIAIYELEREIKKNENPFTQIRQSKDEKKIRKELQEQENLLLEIETMNKFSSDFVKVVKEAALKKKIKVEHLFPDLNTNKSGSKNKLYIKESVLSKIKDERKIIGEYKGSSRRAIPLISDNVIKVPLKKGSSVVSEKRPSTPTSLISRAAPSKSRPITPSSRPVTPRSRPVTPRSRPVTPRSRPVTPRSRPVTPRSRPVTPSSKPVTLKVQPNNNSSAKKLNSPKSRPGSRQNNITPSMITSTSRPTTPRARTPITPKSRSNTTQTNLTIQQKTDTPCSRTTGTIATSVKKVRPKSSFSSRANTPMNPKLDENSNDNDSEFHINNPFKRPNTTSNLSLKNNRQSITPRALSQKVVIKNSKTPTKDKTNPYLNQIITLTSHPLSSKKEVNKKKNNLPDEKNILNINNLLQDLLNIEFEENNNNNNNKTNDEDELSCSNNNLKLQEKRPQSSPIKLKKNLSDKKILINSSRPKSSS